MEDLRVNRALDPGLDVCEVLELVFAPVLFGDPFLHSKIMVLEGIKCCFDWSRLCSFFWTSKLFVLGELSFKTRILKLDLVQGSLEGRRIGKVVMDYWRGFGEGIEKVPDLLLFAVELQRDVPFVPLVALGELDLSHKLVVG